MNITPFRNIIISTEAQLYHQLGFLFIKNKQGIAQIPLRDINTVVLDNKKATISAEALDNLIYHHVLIIGCDGHHLPSSITLSIGRSQNLLIIRHQIHASKQLRARLWQKIIKRKINNQARVLKSHKYYEWHLLKRIVHDVQPYDSSHVEPYAAKMYFRTLIGKHFNRRRPCFINSCLNYGYALIRSMLARDIVAEGMLPYIGIWHHNRFDTFALADDLIEPFRAIVDNFVIKHFDTYTATSSPRLPKLARNQLLCLLTAKVSSNGWQELINRATYAEIESFKSCICEGTSSRLVMPKL